MTIELNMVDKILVPHQAFSDATRRIELCFNAVETAFEPICLPLIGESRTGKTRVLKRIEQAHPGKRLDDGLNLPVLLVKVPSKPTVKGLLEIMLYAIGDPLYKKDTETVKTIRLLNLIKYTNTRLIMLDDLQHFYDRGSKKVLHHLADWLKNFMDDSNTGFILSGLPSCQAVLDQNEQLAGRSMGPVIMSRFDWLADKDRDQFVSILEAMQEGMKGIDMPSLIDEEMAFRMYCACGGLMGYLTKILRLAVWGAYQEDRNHISLEHFAVAFDEAVWRKESVYTKLSNPFDKGFSARPAPELLHSVKSLGTLCPDEIELPLKQVNRKPKSRTVAEAFAH